MHRYGKRLAISLLAILTVQLSAEEDCDKGYNSRVGIKHQEHRGVGYDEGYSTVFTFLSPKWERFLPFIDGRAHIFNDGRFASNLGVGGRFPTFQNKWVFGANVYWDYRDSKKLNTHQIGPGLEALSKYVDFRVNGYIPVSGDRHCAKFKLSKCVNNRAVIKQTSHFALPNISGEVGVPLPWDWSKVVDLYFAVGPYYLFKETGKKSASRQLALGIIPPRQANKARDSWGVKGRLTARVYDGLTLAIESTYDKTFHGTFQGYVSFSFPFGPGNMRTRGSRWKEYYPTPQCDDNAQLRRRLTQQVERFEIIPVERVSRTLNSVNDCAQIAALLQMPQEVFESFASSGSFGEEGSSESQSESTSEIRSQIESISENQSPSESTNESEGGFLRWILSWFSS